jgi:tetratricopeptide (TPR) repeat protein
MTDDANAPALAAIRKAKDLAPQASQRERDYIAAIAMRYSGDPKADRVRLDRDFAAAMKALAANYPDDPDAQVFYVEVLMDTSPWNYWEPGGEKMHTGLEDILPVLERVMARWPDHPGALHLYIHAIEASAKPERAEVAADRLRNLVPGAGHLVHMPGHIYNRVGRYADALQVNLDAQAADERFARESGQKGVYAQMYYIHNMQFAAAAATNVGQGAAAVAQARKAVNNVDIGMAHELPGVETVLPIAQLALLRFGKFDAVLAEPAPDAKLKLASALYHYARARAYAAKGDAAGAEREHARLKRYRRENNYEAFADFGIPARDMVAVADKLVEGDRARLQGDVGRAVALYGEAAVIEAGLPYTEPPFWDFPVQNTLGAALLQAGKAAEAEAAFRRALSDWPKNGWSLFGLMRALKAQGKNAEATAVQADFAKAWARADFQPKLRHY